MSYRGPKLNEAQLKQELETRGVPEALTVYETVVITEDTLFAEKTIADLVSRLRTWGTLSEKQENFLLSLVKQIKERPALEAKRQAEKEAADPVPDGEHVVRGTVLSTKYQNGYYGVQLKMLVKTDQGYTLWGTVPARIDNIQRGDRVAFRATLKQSPNDPKFGFFKRPTQAEIESRGSEANG